MNRSSNGTYANFLILKEVLEINFHPDITLNQTVLNQVDMERKAFMLTHDPLPELYDLSQVKEVILDGNKAIHLDISRLAVYTAGKRIEDIDRIKEMGQLDQAHFKVFNDKEDARVWLSQV
ncbi:hypothetical protein OKW21_002733 [Catalinimonas alkaloidigena]|uniref:hypothetical protein n=1 Tax=Catalinimonas alkaloidigena TaxID=1075417 RepID=UPI0024068B27|nr:hypothetical protein [Catalinimonas alkaloidigena]MDF9797470.1 hypothetical protein [Catalinimonas alkaloidigena]